MMKISKFAASALALALTATLVVPMSANAAQYGGTEVYDVDNTGTATISNDTVTYSYTNTTYRNRITGATSDNNTKDADAVWNSKHYVKETKELAIGTDEYQEFEVELAPGETMTKPKVSKGKGNITIVESYKSESTVTPEWDSDTKQLFFRKSDHSKEVVGSFAGSYPTDEELNAYKRTQYTYSYRIFGKKPGKATLKFKIGSATKKIKVVVSNDNRVFQSVKFAGKLLIQNQDKDRNGTNKNYIECNTNNKNGINYVTKKSGKFSVKMGKNYKFVKALVVKGSPYVTKDDTKDESEDGYVYKTSGSHIERALSTGFDLNGDGDTLDVIYGIDEKSFKRENVKVVKNNKKIKLDTTPEQIKSTKTTTYGDKGQYTSTENVNAKDNMATTTIYVIYQNKLTKTYGHEIFEIHCRTSAK